MKSAALRNKLIEVINTADEDFLNMVNALQKSYFEEKTEDFFEKLPIEVQEIISESRTQARRDETRTHDEVMNLFRKKYDLEE